MQDKPSPRDDGPSQPDRISDEEAMVGRAVLSLVVSLYPERVSIVELAHQLSKSPEDSAIERAIRDLVKAGLFHCDGRYVLATRIALSLDQLRITLPTSAPPSPCQNGGVTS